MTECAELERALAEAGGFAILRDVPAEDIPLVCGALVEGGWRFLEVSLSGPAALDAIAAASGLGNITVGAGTVLTADAAADACKAGAKFLVSPGLRESVAAYAARRAVFYLPGVMTASEVAHGLDLGLTSQKLFPAGLLGERYVRALLAPFPELRLFAVGDVDATNVGAFFDAGVVGVGIGSSIVARATSGGVDLQGTARNAAELMAAIRGATNRR